MKASNILMAFVLLAGATSFAEQRPWKSSDRVEGSATYTKDSNGLKVCTHEGARFAHAFSGTTEVVFDKTTGKSAKYYSDVSLSKRGVHILVNADRTPNMPNYIAKIEDSTVYFDKLGQMDKGILDRGFSFWAEANIRSQAYTVICSKK